ncbi:uncharacterized protein LOC110694601 [Chenopodium quinoa]|uniref:uncharacterized protein LOC110694601 n=1 Tax=Chenopodium quinoa TaxID=63459 RepID=UPI000B78782D|nr:uncharacterized protein LOC110694601 [Chenopodium quinoa]
MSSEIDQAFLQDEDDLKHLTSFEILKSATKILKSNPMFMGLTIMSVLPLFVFMVLHEIKISEVMDGVSKFLLPPSFSYTYYFTGDEFEYDENDLRRKHFRVVLELFPFYLVLLPLLEFFSLPLIVNLGVKIYAGEISSSLTVKEIINEVIYKKVNLKGAFITLFWVQLLSICTFAGLIWTVLSHHFIMQYIFLREDFVQILSIGFHSLIFLGILYKFLEWSVLWNMAMVISVLQIEAGLYALELSAYYGKHCKRTGFKLMLMVLSYSFFLRLPFLLARMCNYVIVVTVAVTVIVFGLVFFGSLVKWVALVTYFYECKAQVLLKKANEEAHKAVEVGDLC